VPPLSEPAFSEFYRNTVRSLWTYVYRTTGNAVDSDDIVQEAFCRLLCADVGERPAEEIRRYVFRVAGNLMIDRWRRLGRERGRRSEALAEPACAPSTLEDEDDLARTFGLLKPRERALLWLAYVERDSHADIAGALGLSRSSVKVLLARARARLRDLLRARESPQGR
jgi:RNA polymerase sigma-70 factor (ECF subfamily)